MTFHGIFKATVDQINASPHQTLLHKGGVIWRELDENAECFYDTWLRQHEDIVFRAKRLDEQLTREVQCAECTKKYGPCDDPNCWFKRKERA